LTIAGGQAEAGTAEAAASAQAADAAGKALVAGDLPAALAALDAAREQDDQGRRVLKAAASVKIVVFGANGPTRQLLVQDALARGLRRGGRQLIVRSPWTSCSCTTLSALPWKMLAVVPLALR